MDKKNAFDVAVEQGADNDVAARLREIRGYTTAAEMGRLCGITGTGWAKLENGQMPGGNVLKKLVELGFSADWILTGNGFMERLNNEGLAEFAEKSTQQVIDIRKELDIGFTEVPKILKKAILSTAGKQSINSVYECISLFGKLK